MKNVILFLFVLLPLSANAIKWKVLGPCSDKPLFQGTYEADLKKSVGEISIEIFDKNKIPYVGVAAGFNSINNSAIGLDALEVVSDEVMRAYGWCYAVNGRMPKVMPDQVTPKNQEDTIAWFYGYSTNIQNEWTDYCVPGYQIKAAQFCEK
ncbi:DUF4430 domain-containing protein [Bdellovibrio svalbardensis]|uniref:DUF4430 domain-containing protein n=1 Tax=Bdellovibrio svalbardensis TaxID=2972972 RepID=A0ABT6DE73_9BACT|nr:DUF4430 domain-containing protein [Bdellovibrio svalbardensis]MDG0814787.1 DUF4430 domain-containing protein [Bdellovibrio svalbardensis]